MLGPGGVPEDKVKKLMKNFSNGHLKSYGHLQAQQLVLLMLMC